MFLKQNLRPILSLRGFNITLLEYIKLIIKHKKRGVTTPL